jgi:hypothetical protein
MEANQEEMEVVESLQEVPNEEAIVETVRALVDFSGNPQPAVGYRNTWEKQIKDDAVRETPKGWTFEKRRRTQPKCSNGIRN